MMIRFSVFLKVIACTSLLWVSSCQPSAPESSSATPAAIQQRVESAKGLQLVHVWATWCDPCRDEFPELVKVMKNFQSLEVLLISADDPAEKEAVDQFLTDHASPVSSLISTELSQKFIETLSPKWAGSLPATFIYKDGKLVDEWEGQRTFEQYAERIQPLLKQ